MRAREACAGILAPKQRDSSPTVREGVYEIKPRRLPFSAAFFFLFANTFLNQPTASLLGAHADLKGATSDLRDASAGVHATSAGARHAGVRVHSAGANMHGASAYLHDAGARVYDPKCFDDGLVSYGIISNAKAGPRLSCRKSLFGGRLSTTRGCTVS